MQILKVQMSPSRVKKIQCDIQRHHVNFEYNLWLLEEANDLLSLFLPTLPHYTIFIFPSSPADSLDVIGFACVTERQLPVFRQSPSTCSVLHGNPSIPPTAWVPSLIRWDNGGGRGTAGSCRPRWETESRVQWTWHEMRPSCIILGNLRPARGHAVHVALLLPALIWEQHQFWTQFHSI